MNVSSDSYQTSLIRYIIGASRIKYEVLDQLYASINFAPYKMGVMYIDAHSIFYRLFKDRNIVNLYSTDKNDLIRDIVVSFYNVLGHYRRYMATRMRLDNDIYVVFNKSVPKYNDMLVCGFYERIIKRYSTVHPDFGFINEALNSAWSFILDLSPFFEGIYCIDNQGVDDFAVINKLGFRDDIFYTIYTRNMYATQLIKPNVTQLYNQRDKSRLITYGTCYKSGILKDLKTVAHDKLTPDLLPILWTFAGCNDISVRSLKYINKTTTMIKIMNKMVDDNMLMKGMSIYSFLDNFGRYLNTTTIPGTLILKIDKEFIINRFKALSANITSAAITSNQWAKIVAQLYDVYNENELEQLNEALVSGHVNPDLLELTNLNMCDAPKYNL